MIESVCLTLAAIPVLIRVTRIVAHMSRCHFKDSWRFHGFALGYSMLGATTLHLVAQSWARAPAAWPEVALVSASALLILFDRRSKRR